ncbi:MAG: methyltransferase domain-containing protein, partial [Gammaproteobacteria bacterium]
MRCLWYAGWAIDPAWLASRLDELPWPEGEQPDCHVAPMGKRERAAWAHELAHPEDKTPRWWCGWSMGGLRAIEMAADDPLCEGIVVLAGTAQFCATDTWPFAIAVDQWRDLLQRWAKQPKQTLKRFYRMIAAGESRASADESASRLADNQFVAELIAQGVDLYANHATDLNEELHWLQSADVREQITRIQKPIVFLVGDQDPLLPAAQADALLSLSPFVRVKRLDGVGHAPFQGRAASCVASALMETFSSVCESADHAVSVSFTPAIDAINHCAINHRAIDGFGAVAARYNAGSALQRAVARSLLRRGPEKALSAASRVLDLGSGSGYIGEYWCQRWGAQPAWHLTGLDGSTAMLAEAARRLPDARLQWCHGYLEDPAMSLPSGADSWDVVVSNFALH